MAEYKFEILNGNSESAELKEFFDSTGNCTIFHRPLFLSYHGLKKFSNFKNFKFSHFIFRDQKNKIKAFIPGAVYQDEIEINIYRTPFYSSHGGMVYDELLQYDDMEKILTMSLDYLKDNETKIISFSQTSDSYCGKYKEKNNYIKYILSSKGFETFNSDMLMVKRNSGNFYGDFHGTISRQINQGMKKGLEFSIEKGVDRESYDLLVRSQTRLGGKPTHSFEELKRINKLFPDSVFTFKTNCRGKLIAGITVFKCNNDVLNTFYIYDDEERRDLKGMQVTYYNVFKFAEENAFKFTDLGPATFGPLPHRSLISYKEKYGIFPDLRITYKKTIE